MADLHYSERDDQVFPELYAKRAAKPPIGAAVRLVVRTFSAYRGASPTFELAGDIAHLPRFETDPHSLAITTGNSTPVNKRVVRMSDVLTLNGQPTNWQTAAPLKDSWLVQGSKGDAYVVRRDGDEWTCSCAGFTFRHRCRHIDDKRNQA